MIQLKLGPARPVDPGSDDMGREWVGWTPDQTEEQLYERNRGLWLLGPKADRQRYAVFTSIQTGLIVAVVEVAEIESYPGGKRAIVGTALGPGHLVRDQLHGQPALDNHRNPMTYPDHPLDVNQCACGCGEAAPAGRDFQPGHDQRAVHARITHQWGSILQFITWYDDTYGAPPQLATVSR